MQITHPSRATTSHSLCFHPFGASGARQTQCIHKSFPIGASWTRPSSQVPYFPSLVHLGCTIHSFLRLIIQPNNSTSSQFVLKQSFTTQMPQTSIQIPYSHRPHPFNKIYQPNHIYHIKSIIIQSTKNQPSKSLIV